ncbi:MAG: cytochrome c [Chloroflexota bacterium]|nr:cytochrome c [Chloroflexota bacterium]
MMRLLTLALAACALAACAAPTATDPLERGRQVYREKACASCHQLGGNGGTVGPPLTHIGSVAGARKAGTSAEDYIRESIRDPGAYVVPGFPDTMSRGIDRGMSQDDFDDLVRFLLSLQ